MLDLSRTYLVHEFYTDAPFWVTREMRMGESVVRGTFYPSKDWTNQRLYASTELFR